MQWIEFLDTARRLQTGGTEGDWRSAVSRAYYAVFHFFRGWLSQQGIDVGSGAQAHNSLYVGIWNCGIPSVAPIGNRIDTLRKARTFADYDLRTAIPVIKAIGTIQEANAVIIDFQNLTTSVSPGSISLGVKQYLIAIGRLPKTP